MASLVNVRKRGAAPQRGQPGERRLWAGSDKTTLAHRCKVIDNYVSLSVTLSRAMSASLRHSSGGVLTGTQDQGEVPALSSAVAL